ncbi:hypothetical protein [Phascolarctobacterium faecium]|uniref:hypothetical protein n=1 Tax=Phascolarctobacterium faecium TaxID=33025 RepID=UPI003FEED43F
MIEPISLNVAVPSIDLENPNRGEPGRDGIGVHYMGEISEYSALPSAAKEGDAYYLAGRLYIRSNDTWPEEGKGIQYQGPPGEMSGLTGIATTEEAIAGESDTKAMTPLKTKEAINAQTQNKADLVDGKVPKDQLPSSVYIPANSNLDTYLETGDYYSPIDVEAATITNAPLKTAFFLRVDRVNATNIKQVITHYPFDSRTFYRLYYAGEWSAWLELARFNAEGHLVLPNGAEFWIG